MNKVWRIARTEYLTAVRSKAFIVSVLLTPLLVLGTMGLQAILKDKVDTKTRRFAVLDESGKLYSVLEAKARWRNEQEIFARAHEGKGKQVQPEFIPEPATGGTNAELLLSERVRRKELFAFLIISSNLVETGSTPAFAYYTQTPTYGPLPNWIEQVLNDEIQRLRFASAGIDQNQIRTLMQGVSLKRLGLAKVSAAGEVQKAAEENRIMSFAIPFVSMFLLFILVMSITPVLLSNVLEEKLQKIVEVLISSVSPFQLMMGKLVGTVLVSLTLSIIYLGSLVALAWHFEVLGLIPVPLFFWFMVFQVLALFTFGSMFSAIGAACGDIRDSQTMMWPAMILVMLPMFVWLHVWQAPGSLFARAVSLFPPTTPMLMLLRIAIPPGPPLWEILLSFFLSAAFMFLCVAASAKIFRIGVLAQGQTPGFGRMLSWIFSK